MFSFCFEKKIGSELGNIDINMYCNIAMQYDQSKKLAKKLKDCKIGAQQYGMKNNICMRAGNHMSLIVGMEVIIMTLNRQAYW
jgi:hypothetical protein